MGKDSDIRYVVLQIHYDNPTLDLSQQDSTGVRVRMTTDLRANTAGFLFNGVYTDKIVIPPGESEWEISGNCTSAATSNMPFALNVFAVATHAHLTGRLVWTEIWRKGKFVEYLTPEWVYDFSDQKMVRVSKTLHPGDELITHCVYDTTGKVRCLHRIHCLVRLTTALSRLLLSWVAMPRATRCVSLVLFIGQSWMRLRACQTQRCGAASRARRDRTDSRFLRPFGHSRSNSIGHFVDQSDLPELPSTNGGGGSGRGSRGPWQSESEERGISRDSDCLLLLRCIRCFHRTCTRCVRK